MFFEDINAEHKEFREVFSYHGPVSNPIISELGEFIRVWLQKEQKMSRKVFSVFIELVQNISSYSKSLMSIKEDVEWGVGRFALSHDEDFFYLESVNLVTTAVAAKLDESIEFINSLDHQALRKYKREQRDKPASSESKGAGIGLIQIALLSNNPLQASFQQYGEGFFYYSNKVKISKALHGKSKKKL